MSLLNDCEKIKNLRRELGRLNEKLKARNRLIIKLKDEIVKLKEEKEKR